MNKEKKTLLVVEDNFLNREILVDILSDYNCLEAENGQEALDILSEQSENISLILLDVQMPVMNGYEFLDEFVKHGTYQSIPVIVVTGSDASEEEKCLVLGASDFIQKPYLPNVVLRRVEALIRLRESVTLIDVLKFDKLTGTYSKNIFAHYFHQLLTNNPNVNYSVVMSNIKDFRRLNDVYGDEICDQYLAYFADAIRTVTNADYLYGRISGDRFAFIFDNSKIDCLKFIEDLNNAISINPPLAEVKVKYAIYSNVDHNIGVTTILNRLGEVIRSIDKRYDVQIGYFDEEMIRKQEEIYFVTDNMINSLANKEFHVFYQPKHNAKTHELVGCEALIRWIHPDKGMISPIKFIPVFEQNGFITNVDLYVLDKVCYDLHNRLEEGKKCVPVSVNLSRVDLLAIKDLSIIDDILNKYNIDKSYIHFEITESVCEYGNEILDQARNLQNRGYMIEIDDFGNGYSSLGMLKDIPMDIMKLDMTFARNLEKQKDVVKMVISLAHELNVLTVAEGVEDDVQLATLVELGCDYIQGYYFSKPLNHDDFMNYIDKI